MGIACHQADLLRLRLLATPLCDDFARVVFLLDDDDRSAAARLPPPRILWRSASIRSTTFEGRSAGSSYSMGLPAALRFTSFFSAVSNSSVNSDGSKCPALVSRMCEARLSISFGIRGLGTER